MTPEHLKEVRQAMHLPVRGLARWAGISESSIRQMESGKRSIPAAFGTWIDQLGHWQRKFPPPAKTR